MKIGQRDRVRMMEMGKSGLRRGRGLGFWYRLSYGVRWILFHIFGPPQLTPENDPIERLRREREQRRAKRAGARSPHEDRGRP